MHLLQRLSLLCTCGLLLAAPVLPQTQGPAHKKKRQRQAMPDPWSNEANVAKGSEMLTSLFDAAGGLEQWQALDGLKFDLLETWRVLTDRRTGEFKVHHYTPRLCWFKPNGDGWVRSEFVRPGSFTPMYRREVAVGNYAWSDSETEFNRKPKASALARARINRLHFLTTAPFSFHERGAELVFLKDLGPDQALYGMRLARPLVMSIQEEISEFALIVDTKNKRAVQLQYSLVGKDRETTDRSTECFVDFEGSLEVGGVTLPHKHVWFFELDLRTEEYLVEDLTNEALPPESLRRPWLTGEVWKTDLRADHWDPPAKEGEPER